MHGYFLTSVLSFIAVQFKIRKFNIDLIPLCNPQVINFVYCPNNIFCRSISLGIRPRTMHCIESVSNLEQFLNLSLVLKALSQGLPVENTCLACTRPSVQFLAPQEEKTLDLLDIQPSQLCRILDWDYLMPYIMRHIMVASPTMQYISFNYLRKMLPAKFLYYNVSSVPLQLRSHLLRGISRPCTCLIPHQTSLPIA